LQHAVVSTGIPTHTPTAIPGNLEKLLDEPERAVDRQRQLACDTAGHARRWEA
jgi:hypothetical protein